MISSYFHASARLESETRSVGLGRSKNSSCGTSEELCQSDRAVFPRRAQARGAQQDEPPRGDAPCVPLAGSTEAPRERRLWRHAKFQRRALKRLGAFREPR